MASEKFAALRTGRTHLVKLARTLLAHEQGFAASDAQSLTAVTAPGNSGAEQLSSSLGQALTAISAGIEDLSKHLQHAIEEQSATDQVKQSEVAQAQQEKQSAFELGATDLQLDAFETRLAKSVGNGIRLKSYAERPLAADSAQLEAEFLGDLPDIRKWLAPLLKSGHPQLEAAGQTTTESQSPMSLTALRKCGALSNSEEGLSNLARAMGFGNDRKAAGFVRFTAGTLSEEHRMYVVPASRLLLKYQSLLVEKGMLAE